MITLTFDMMIRVLRLKLRLKFLLFVLGQIVI